MTDYTLYLVADADYAVGRDLPAMVKAAVEGGVKVVQLRGKALAGRALVELGFELRRILAGTGVPLLINDRVDVAIACGAAGVHLGQEDIPVVLARALLGPEGTVGVSVNTVEEARRAQAEGASYVGAGPVFVTTTKETSLPVLGPEGIARIKRAVEIPVVAIGGIDLRNAADVARAGADGMAVVSAVLGAPDARLAAEDLIKVFESG
ncbi:MAG TPA: thiamine phosphate synthase [Acidobacteriota bacterium]|nr:thiamine phosphate synthase [Acidobacteriota bacterium]